LTKTLPLPISNPTNLAFAGDSTLFAVGRCKGNGWGQGAGCLAVQSLAVPSPPTARPTPPPATGGTLSGFGAHIEGVSVDPSADYLYAVHFRGDSKDNNAGRNVIGRIAVSDAKAGKFDSAKAWFTGKQTGSVFNGMKWSGKFVYLADVGRGAVVQVDTSANNAAKDFCTDAGMKKDGVPNDLALSPNGNLFLSGQQWGASTGALWMCSKTGTAKRLEGGMQRTNGIALSPDGSILYLSEATGSSKITKQVIYKYTVADDGSVSGKSLFYTFTGDETVVDTDGMRTDKDGNLYVTRNGLGKVVVLSPEGKLTKTLPIPITNPTNLAFAGDSTLFAVGRCKGNGWGQGDGCLAVQSLVVQSPPTAKPGGGAEAVSGAGAATLQLLLFMVMSLWML